MLSSPLSDRRDVLFIERQDSLYRFGVGSSAIAFNVCGQIATYAKCLSVLDKLSYTWVLIHPSSLPLTTKKLFRWILAYPLWGEVTYTRKKVPHQFHKGSNWSGELDYSKACRYEAENNIPVISMPILVSLDIIFFFSLSSTSFSAITLSSYSLKYFIQSPSSH